MTEPYVPTWVDEPAPPDPPVSYVRVVAVAVAVLLLGAPAGLAWARLAPPFPVAFAQGGPGVEEFDAGVFFQIDGTYLVVAAIAGILCGAGAWLFGRRQGPPAVVGLAAGSLAAAAVAREVGERVVVDSRLREFCVGAVDNGLCALYDGTPELRSPGLVLAWATVALLTFSIATIADRDR